MGNEAIVSTSVDVFPVPALTPIIMPPDSKAAQAKNDRITRLFLSLLCRFSLDLGTTWSDGQNGKAASFSPLGECSLHDWFQGFITDSLI